MRAPPRSSGRLFAGDAEGDDTIAPSTEPKRPNTVTVGGKPGAPDSLAAYLLPYAAGVVLALVLASAAFYAVVTS